MRRHRLVTLGNRCTTTEAPVLLHKTRIFGLSNEQVLCIIHLCSIFHVVAQESGFWSLPGALSGKNKCCPTCRSALVFLFRRSLGWIRSSGNVHVSVCDPYIRTYT